MTNEELAQAIQQGEQLFPQLWEQTKLFIYRAANSYFRRMESRCTASGVTVEDLCQEGYLALVDAVRAYDGEYKLLTYLKYPLLNHFNALVGYRTRRRDGLNNCASLDDTLPGTDDLTVGDTIPDPMAAEAFLDAEETLFIADLRRDLDTAISGLGEQEATVIRCKHLEGCKMSDIAATLGVSYTRCTAIEHKALGRLRGRAGAVLQGYRDIISSYGYRGSLASWRHTHTSSTERAVLTIEERYGDIMRDVEGLRRNSVP